MVLGLLSGFLGCVNVKMGESGVMMLLSASFLDTFVSFKDKPPRRLMQANSCKH
jgi:hypothetical protein